MKKDTVDEVADRMMALPEGTRLQALFPLQPPPAPQPPEKTERLGRRPRKKKSEASDDSLLKERLLELRNRGFLPPLPERNDLRLLDPGIVLDVNFAEPVYVLIDRIAIAPDVRSRLVDAVEQGYREAGEVIFDTAPRDDEPVQRFRFSQRFECKNDGTRYDEPEPRLFSFNNPYGACPEVPGLRQHHRLRPEPGHPQQVPYAGGRRDRAVDEAEVQVAGDGDEALRAGAGVPLDVPWEDLTTEQQNFVLKGDGKWWGVRGFFDYLERKKYKLHVRVFLSRYRGYSVCPGLQRAAPAPGSAAGEGGRQGHLPGFGDDGRGGHQVLCRFATYARRGRHCRSLADGDSRPPALHE